MVSNKKYYTSQFRAVHFTLKICKGIIS